LAEKTVLSIATAHLQQTASDAPTLSIDRRPGRGTHTGSFRNTGLWQIEKTV
jgi:hypothetical protein